MSGGIESALDVTGDEGMVRTLLGLLEQGDLKIKALKAVAVANGNELDDPVAGEAPTEEDGTVNSYRRQIGLVEQQRERLKTAWPDEYELAVQRIREVADRRSREKAAAAPAAAPRAARRAAAKPKAKGSARKR